MQNIIYYLSTCDTCKRILKEVQASNYDINMQDIKTEPINEAQLEELKNKAGSYETLFSKRAMLYKSLGLAGKHLSEQDYKKYLLTHYSFLKRPVFIYNGELFIGSDKKTVERLKASLHEQKNTRS